MLLKKAIPYVFSFFFSIFSQIVILEILSRINILKVADLQFNPVSEERRMCVFFRAGHPGLKNEGAFTRVLPAYVNPIFYRGGFTKPYVTKNRKSGTCAGSSETWQYDKKDFAKFLTNFAKNLKISQLFLEFCKKI